MHLRASLLLAALATAPVACTVYTVEPGAVAADGSVYLGWHLFSGKKSDREAFPIGDRLGAFSSIRLHAERGIQLNEVLVIFADGERFRAPAPGTLGAEQWSAPIALPRGPRVIHSVEVTARGQGKHLAKLEIYGTR